jgi:GNAT superfamily N-acetyltransferase
MHPMAGPPPPPPPVFSPQGQKTPPLCPHVFTPRPGPPGGARGLYTPPLSAAPAGRGTGLARALVAATLTHQTWGARYITLGVSPDNSQALRFYQKTGFTLRGYEMMIREGSTLPDLP